MLNIVLFEPEIPQNTGNIMRTCVGLNATLHLIEPMGFKIDEAKLKRSAVDYYEYINYTVYQNWEDFVNKNQGCYFFLTRYAQQTYSSIDYTKINKPVYLIFGSESRGIKKEILLNNLENTYRIPMSEHLRTLNLSNTVAICGYEYARQFEFKTLLTKEPYVFSDDNYLERLKEIIK